MSSSAFKKIGRHKEQTLFLAVLVLGTLAALAGVSGWMRPETWGVPITTLKLHDDRAVPAVETPDFKSIWENGGRNPFGDSAVELESAGKARLPLPPALPLAPEMPPVGLLQPGDLLSEGAR